MSATMHTLVWLCLVIVSGCRGHIPRSDPRATGTTCQQASTLERWRNDLSPYGAIAGEVYTIRGVPLPGVAVVVVDSSGQHVRGAVSSHDGRIQIDSVLPGRHRVQFVTIGYNAQNHDVIIVSARAQALCAVLSETAIPISH